MARTFLRADWRNLIMANYIVQPDVLLPYLPAGTSLDQHNGNTYVSLVGFLFANTRVLGAKFPFHINFEEVNLRFYVTHRNGNELRRGVVFIKEIVPKAAITFIAKTLYREKYCTMPMSHSFELGTGLTVQYNWKHRSEANSIGVVSEPYVVPMVAGSEEEFIAEHYFGYSRFNARRTFEYRVSHPRWNLYPVKEYAINCNFEQLYGEPFAGLSQAVPTSVFLAKGSEITVSDKREL